MDVSIEKGVFFCCSEYISERFAHVSIVFIVYYSNGGYHDYQLIFEMILDKVTLL